MEQVLLKPIGKVISGREVIEDDFWGSEISIIEIDSAQYSTDVLMGLTDFSHLEVIYFMHGVKEDQIELTARHPRNNLNWPKVGIFAQRPKARPNRIGLSRCKIISIHNYQITVQSLDAIVGTPILDIKPYMKEFGPIGKVEQPHWANELMDRYYK
ncbi:tRNA-Thr(GGU) m(6)t(6)A37 methyltransferase TsaA [Bacillus mesophilus]|uniref:SAM-dependent methyltransferase n=1 Tax=Bacillus mesophilus TaxID=1808955 RepID=A0A6M0QAI6_9BACI|nr:SAM-dependent methyltransferase [Bacillus mesophilus]MBM7662085.1 tRNA-Thr(GGU) m(6)t(6)A37 methyltransferase TsaA [Bacillus mesophilus]NEY72560.1 SAM-dependent methyltransferase [Bacillus mesophilus]